MNPSYETWKMKSNPKYPPVEKIREEILQMYKGMYTATICPALSLWLAQRGWSQAFCGWGGYSIGYHLFSFACIWIGSDFVEFYYHRLGHMTDLGWTHHRHHHKFFNPTPFAVIADEYVDQFMRSLPLLIFPLIMPTNMDVIFFTYAVFFYGYGVYLHWGYELEWPDAHHPWLNTAYQHYIHHAKSLKNRPIHTGFFFKFWDQTADSTLKDTCTCVKCQHQRGERTLEVYNATEKPDYSPLLSLKFWMTSPPTKKTGKSVN